MPFNGSVTVVILVIVFASCAVWEFFIGRKYFACTTPLVSGMAEAAITSSPKAPAAIPSPYAPAAAITSPLQFDSSSNVPSPDQLSCPSLGLPQKRNAIPLPDSAFTFDHGTKTSNYAVGTLSKEPRILLALPRAFSDRIDKTTGLFWGAGNSDDTYARAGKAERGKGLFVDVGGWIGDSSLPSAALGIDTYVFEPVRYNTNLMHISRFINDCTVSKHLTIVNTMVSDADGNTSIFVTERSDNSAATKNLARLVVGGHQADYEQRVPVITLDSFFPPGTKVQNLKIDVQGFELHVLKGAKRLLQENLGFLKVRFEAHEGLLHVAGTNVAEVLSFMQGLGYKVVARGGDIDME